MLVAITEKIFHIFFTEVGLHYLCDETKTRTAQRRTPTCVTLNTCSCGRTIKDSSVLTQL